MRNTIIFFSILLFAATSCSKQFLDVPDQATIIQQAYVKDLASTQAYFTGTYIMLEQYFFQGLYNPVYGEIVADNIKMRLATSTDLSVHYNWSQIADNSSSSNKNMNGIWTAGYLTISGCNFAMEKAGEYRNEDPVKADYIKAQALTLRAMIHFMLTNIFAQSYNFTPDASHMGIPYSTGYDWTKPATTRSSVKAVYDNMIRDLAEALSLFGNNPVDRFSANKNMAKALLARIYLYKGDFAQAKNYAREVSTLVPIMPAGPSGYPSQLFTTGETEALFQLVPMDFGITIPSPNGSYSGSYSTYYTGVYFSGNKKFIATQDIRNAIARNPSDLRNAWIASTLDITKYPSNVIAGFTYPSGSYYQTMFRSSEM